MIRHATACALARSPHPEAKKLLLSMCDDPYFAVRTTILHALDKIHSAESLALVRKMTQDPDNAVRDQALQCLRNASCVHMIQLVDKDDVPSGLYAGVPFYEMDDHPGRSGSTI